MKVVRLRETDVVRPEHPEVIPALGAALTASGEAKSINEWKALLHDAPRQITVKGRLEPLFASSGDFARWQNEHAPVAIPRTALADYTGDCFLGVDSGSTTTKIVALGENDELLFGFYRNNNGMPVETVQAGLQELKSALDSAGKSPTILRSVVTGYGEDLIRAAFGMDDGVVETIAHYAGARHIDPDVSFILDIGGQDMKAIFIRDGAIQRIELNESCSSGCGSFLETFAHNVGMSAQDFGLCACRSGAPCDLGTRCTVFMNSKVKQALRENATMEDIAAGLSYSVIKNALIKVLNVTNPDDLGERLSVQGGAFRNPSVRRALEILSGKPVVMTDIPELMGAFGAAVIAARQWRRLTQAA
jgi:predicted CoA-substrate-specific enzyme activase